MLPSKHTHTGKQRAPLPWRRLATSFSGNASRAKDADRVLRVQRVLSEGRGPQRRQKKQKSNAPRTNRQRRARIGNRNENWEKKRQKSKKRNEKRHTNESTSFSTKDTETKSTDCTGCERRTKEKRGTFFWDWIGPCYVMGTDADCFVNELVSIWYFCVLKFWKSCRVGLRIVFSFSFYHWRIFCFLKL